MNSSTECARNLRSGPIARHRDGVRAFVLALVALPAGVSADVTTRERVQLGGPMGALAKMSIENSTAVAGDKARMDTKVTCGNALMRMLCPGDSAQIVRLDRDTTWQLDLAKKTWYAESFESYRVRQQRAAEEMRKAQAAQTGREEPAAEETQCDLEPARSDVKRTGEKGSFAGFDAERTTITVTQACKDRATGKICETRWVADQWLTTAEVAQAEQRRFWQAYAKKLLRDEAEARALAAQALAYMDSHRSSFGELAKRLAEQTGTPLKHTLGLSIGGAGCADSAQAQAAAAGAAGEKPSVGSAIAGALGGSLGGALFKRAKKKDAEPTPEANAAAPPPGFNTVFEMTTEVTSVDVGSLPTDRFEIPAGFRQIEPPALPTP